MDSLFPHSVIIQGEAWHAVSWCSVHISPDAWSFHLEMDPDDPDADELYVFSFADQNMAIQFALLYG
jgi:hypothetical protein